METQNPNMSQLKCFHIFIWHGDDITRTLIFYYLISINTPTPDNTNTNPSFTKSNNDILIHHNRAKEYEVSNFIKNNSSLLHVGSWPKVKVI